MSLKWNNNCPWPWLAVYNDGVLPQTPTICNIWYNYYLKEGFGEYGI